MRYVSFLLMCLSAMCFLSMSGLTVLFGERAVPSTIPVMKSIYDQRDIVAHAQLLKMCKREFCKEWLADRILNVNPRHLDSLGVKAIGLSRRGLWDDAKELFEEYFAEGGTAPEVQRWHQKLLSGQASLKADR